MDIKLSGRPFVVFDLDDTLYPEIDFLRSAFRSIADRLQPQLGEHVGEQMVARFLQADNVFDWLLTSYRERLPAEVDIAWLLRHYREHVPEIALAPAVSAFLDDLQRLRVPTGLITDGRSLTQRNKLRVLGLADYFRAVVISEEFGSEKPDPRNYRFFSERYPGHEFYFIGDNTRKDFIAPIALGWRTICLKNEGRHIHAQDLHCVPQPDCFISSLAELRLAP